MYGSTATLMTPFSMVSRPAAALPTAVGLAALVPHPASRTAPARATAAIGRAARTVRRGLIGLILISSAGGGSRSRVGTFHEASVEVVRTLRPATHSAAQARSLRGVRPGITLPIVLGETAMGTVGITGSPGQVHRFGLVVKRQTEILLQE